jgi:hypothetical protein
MMAAGGRMIAAGATDGGNGRGRMIAAGAA